MGNDDLLVQELSTQQWRVWAVLRDGRPHTIEDLFDQMCPAPSAVSRRRKQQRLGAIITRINQLLLTNAPALIIAPGEPRATYQVFTL